MLATWSSKLKLTTQFVALLQPMAGTGNLAHAWLICTDEISNVYSYANVLFFHVFSVFSRHDEWPFDSLLQSHMTEVLQGDLPVFWSTVDKVQAAEGISSAPWRLGRLGGQRSLAWNLILSRLCSMPDMPRFHVSSSFFVSLCKRALVMECLNWYLNWNWLWGSTCKVYFPTHDEINQGNIEGAKLSGWIGGMADAFCNTKQCPAGSWRPACRYDLMAPIQ